MPKSTNDTNVFEIATRVMLEGHIQYFRGHTLIQIYWTPHSSREVYVLLAPKCSPNK